MRAESIRYPLLSKEPSVRASTHYSLQYPAPILRAHLGVELLEGKPPRLARVCTRGHLCEGAVALNTGCECDWMSPLRFGYRSQNSASGFPAYLKGVIDEVVLLDAALTEQAALNIYLDYLGTAWPTTAMKPTPRPTFAPASPYLR